MKTKYMMVGVGIGLLALAACSSDAQDGKKDGVSAKVRVGQLGTSGVKIAATDSRWEDAPISTGNFAFAKVDGIRLKLTGIRGKTTSGEQEFSRYQTPQVLDFEGQDSSIAFNGDISIPEGSYSELSVSLKNSYAIKAFCQTADKSIYTTPAGIKSCVRGQIPDLCVEGSLPVDYGYYEYGFMHMRPEQELMESVKFNFDVKAADTPTLTVLLDKSYVVSCTDLLGVNLDSSSDRLAPFSWSLGSGKTLSGWFDDGESHDGHFATSYLPLFTHVSNSGSEAIPEGETYAAWLATDDTKDLADAMITTVAFLDNGDILAARSRNFDRAGDTGLMQGWSGFSTQAGASASYTLMNGEHWGGAKGDYSDARWLQDRKIVGFERTDIAPIDDPAEVVQAIEVMDGPDCGKNLGEKVRACLGVDVAIETVWRRIAR